MTPSDRFARLLVGLRSEALSLLPRGDHSSDHPTLRAPTELERARCVVDHLDALAIALDDESECGSRCRCGSWVWGDAPALQCVECHTEALDRAYSAVAQERDGLHDRLVGAGLPCSPAGSGDCPVCAVQRLMEVRRG